MDALLSGAAAYAKKLWKCLGRSARGHSSNFRAYSRNHAGMRLLAEALTGWTECAPVLVREQSLLTAVLGEIRKLPPFPLPSSDTAATACS
jgi:hypothetical protein